MQDSWEITINTTEYNVIRATISVNEITEHIVNIKLEQVHGFFFFSIIFFAFKKSKGYTVRQYMANGDVDPEIMSYSSKVNIENNSIPR